MYYVLMHMYLTVKVDTPKDFRAEWIQFMYITSGKFVQ